MNHSFQTPKPQNLVKSFIFDFSVSTFYMVRILKRYLHEKPASCQNTQLLCFDIFQIMTRRPLKDRLMDVKF